VNFEIVPRRPDVRRRRPGLVALVIELFFALLILASLAHADQNGLSYEHWQDSTTGWHGQLRRQGITTDYDAYGPDGRQHVVGDAAYTTCY